MLPQFVIDALKQHRIHQLEARLKIGDAWVDRDLVFSNINGDYYHRRELKQIGKKEEEREDISFLW